MTSLAGNNIAGTPRFLLYSHDALGLGHVRRNLVIAAALVERSPGSKPRRFHRLVAAWLQVGHQTFTISAAPKEGL
jgi:hypothetical protein